jgi:hypothetical protein
MIFPFDVWFASVLVCVLVASPTTPAMLLACLFRLKPSEPLLRLQMAQLTLMLIAFRCVERRIA